VRVLDIQAVFGQKVPTLHDSDATYLGCGFNS